MNIVFLKDFFFQKSKNGIRQLIVRTEVKDVTFVVLGKSVNLTVIWLTFIKRSSEYLETTVKAAFY